MELLHAVRPGANQYLSGASVLKELVSYLHPFDTPAIITGQQSLAVFTNYWKQALPWPIFYYDRTSSEEDMARLAQQAKGHDLLIGIGGGRVLDTVKGVADLLGIEYVLIPTLISNCAPYTPVIAVYHPDHSFKKIGYCQRAPYLTIVDWQLLLSTPQDYLIAGVGDTLAKWYEINGITERMPDSEQTAFIRLGIESAREIQTILLENAQAALRSLTSQTLSTSFGKIADTIIGLAGTVGAFAGIYGRCAGAHAIHNALSFLPATHSILHGAKVAYGILVQLAVTAEWDEINQLLPFYREIGLPTSLTALNITEGLPEVTACVAERAVVPEESFVLMRPQITKETVIAAIETVEKTQKQNTIQP